jgi:ankyrin repeat protein
LQDGGVVEIVRLVLEAGGDADERGGINGTETPLFVAARQGRADLVALLLEHGADPNARRSVGGAPIETAAPFPEVLRLIARAGAKPTKPSIAEAIRRLLGR